jgi:hypothetical protein
MKSKFTPGPWYVFTHPRLEEQGPHFSITTKEDYDLSDEGEDTTLAGIWSGDPVDRANARLMAAAPQLLAALKNANELITLLIPGVKCIVLQDYGFLNNTCLEVEATIKLAEGE